MKGSLRAPFLFIMAKRGRKYLGRRICKVCGKNPTTLQRIANGKRYYKSICTVCHKNKYREYKKDYCERCNFVAVHLSQLDIHHKNGDHKDNNPGNLEAVCVNCHRLEHNI